MAIPAPPYQQTEDFATPIMRAGQSVQEGVAHVGKGLSDWGQSLGDRRALLIKSKSEEETKRAAEQNRARESYPKYEGEVRALVSEEAVRTELGEALVGDNSLPLDVRKSAAAYLKKLSGQSLLNYQTGYAAHKQAEALREANGVPLPNVRGTVNGTQRNAAAPAAAAPTAPTAATYQIKQGDTLSKIAKKLGVSVQELARANNIKNVNLIHPGTTLTIPGQAPASASDFPDLPGGVLPYVQDPVTMGAPLMPSPPGGPSPMEAQFSGPMPLTRLNKFAPGKFDSKTGRYADPSAQEPVRPLNEVMVNRTQLSAASPPPAAPPAAQAAPQTPYDPETDDVPTDDNPSLFHAALSTANYATGVLAQAQSAVDNMRNQLFVGLFKSAKVRPDDDDKAATTKITNQMAAEIVQAQDDPMRQKQLTGLLSYLTSTDQFATWIQKTRSGGAPQTSFSVGIDMKEKEMFYGQKKERLDRAMKMFEEANKLHGERQKKATLLGMMELGPVLAASVYGENVKPALADQVARKFSAAIYDDSLMNDPSKITPEALSYLRQLGMYSTFLPEDAQTNLNLLLENAKDLLEAENPTNLGGDKSFKFTLRRAGQAGK